MSIFFDSTGAVKHLITRPSSKPLPLPQSTKAYMNATLGIFELVHTAQPYSLVERHTLNSRFSVSLSEADATRSRPTAVGRWQASGATTANGFFRWFPCLVAKSSPPRHHPC